MNPAEIAPLAAPLAQAAHPGSRQPDDPAKVKDAAQQFEALMIEQILKSASENGELFGSGSDAASGTVMDMATQQFAIAMARGGGLGLAGMVAKGLGSRGDSR
jgi:Rod binding domain-containing protein